MTEFYLELYHPIENHEEIESIVYKLERAMKRDFSSLRKKIQRGSGCLIKTTSFKDAKKYQEYFSRHIGLRTIVKVTPQVAPNNDDTRVSCSITIQREAGDLAGPVKPSPWHERTIGLRASLLNTMRRVQLF